MKKKIFCLILIICMFVSSIYSNLVFAIVLPRLGITSPSSGTVEIGGTIRYTVNIYNATEVTLNPSDIKISGVYADISVEGEGNNQRVIVLSNIQGDIGSIGYISYIAGGVAKNEAGESREMNITSTSFTVIDSSYVLPPAVSILIGDANQDGEITKEDADYINYLYESGITVDDELLIICDVDGNGKITPYDAFLINTMLENNYQKGDINQDGQLTKEDALLLAEHFINNTLTDSDKELGDVNGDGTINIKDAQEIYLMLDPDFLIGDINMDNIINVNDVNSIMRKIISDEGPTIEDIICADYYGEGTLDQSEADLYMNIVIGKYKKGDINRDGVINSIDAAIVIDKYKSNTVYKDDLNRADMNGDNTLNSTDAAMIIDKYKNNQ